MPLWGVIYCSCFASISSFRSRISISWFKFGQKLILLNIPAEFEKVEKFYWRLDVRDKINDSGLTSNCVVGRKLINPALNAVIMLDSLLSATSLRYLSPLWHENFHKSFTIRSKVPKELNKFESASGDVEVSHLLILRDGNSTCKMWFTKLFCLLLLSSLIWLKIKRRENKSHLA